jgi:aryl-alcohol dehydrogenase-like predicted oxidoreductase
VHRGERLYVATKVPPKDGQFPPASGMDATDAFPGSWIRENLERSLRASGLDAFDVLQLHVWSDEWVGRRRLVRYGADAEAAGADPGVRGVDTLALIRTGVVDTVQVIYNVFHQQPQEQLLPECASHGVGVIVRVALDEVGLTGRIGADTEFPADDWRNSYFGGDRRRQVADHVDALISDLGIDRDDLPGLALRYVLTAPQVSTVIAGMRSVRNVDRNAAVSDGQALSAPRRAALARHRWERNFYPPA